MTPAQKRALELDRRGLSDREIAQALHTSQGSVKQLLYRARSEIEFDRFLQAVPSREGLEEK